MPQVRDVLMNCQLTPHGWKPVVAIDECQVLDEVFGWGGFRSSYGNETWAWLIAEKQMADSQEPGGKQDQDTGDIFFHSMSLTKFRFCGFRVGHLSSILLFASSTCLLPPIEGIIRIKDFCTPATIESSNI